MIFQRFGWSVAALILLGSLGPARALELSSPDFKDGQPMPAKYAKKSGNISPALRIKGVPEGTKTLILIVDDPDAPKDGDYAFTHWIVFNIEPHHAAFLEGRPPRGALQGKNSMGDNKYDGPQPPSGTHRYIFHLYAMKGAPELTAKTDRKAVEYTLSNRELVLAEAQTSGTYSAK